MADEDNSNVQQVLKKLDEQHSKYRFMETNLLAKKRRFVHLVFSLHCKFIYSCVMQIEDANSGFGTVFEHDQVITKAERSRR